MPGNAHPSHTLHTARRGRRTTTSKRGTRSPMSLTKSAEVQLMSVATTMHSAPLAQNALAPSSAR